MRTKVVHILPHSPGPASRVPNPRVDSSSNPDDFNHFIKTENYPYWAGFFQNDWHVQVATETQKRTNKYNIECWRYYNGLDKIYEKTISDIKHVIFPSSHNFLDNSEFSTELNKRLIKESNNKKLIVIIHGLFSKDSNSILNSLRKISVPVILQHHGGKSGLERYFEKPSLRNWVLLNYEKCQYKYVDFLFISNRTQEYYAQKMLPLTFTKVVPMGFDFIDIKHKKVVSRQKLNLPKDSRIILFVGRFVDVKGFYDLVESSFHLNKKYQNLLFVCVGGQPEEIVLDSKVRNFKLLGRVSRKILFEYYNAADVFVLPSHREGCSISRLEALFSDLPIVTTRTGNYDEIIKFTDKAFLVDISSPLLLAKSIEESLSIDRLVKVPKDRIQRYFGWDRIINNHIKSYRFLSSRLESN